MRQALLERGWPLIGLPSVMTQRTASGRCREQTRLGTTEALADQAHLAAALRMQPVDGREHRFFDARARAVVATEVPPVDLVAAARQEVAQQTRRTVARDQARQHQHRVPVATRCEAQPRQRRETGGQLSRRDGGATREAVVLAVSMLVSDCLPWFMVYRRYLERR